MENQKTNINQETAVQTPEAPEQTETTTPAINSDTVADIMALVTKATSSSFYMSNAKRVAILIDALKIPPSDDKSFQMFYTHAERDLQGESYKKARTLGTTPTEVTLTQIMAEAQARYSKKHGKIAIVNEEYM